MQELSYFEYFYCVAVNKNISKASEILHVSQPAVSKALSKLEEILCCKLFDRSRKGVVLTNEGLLLFKAVKEIYALMNRTKNLFLYGAANEQQTVTVGIGRDLCEYYLLPHIKVFSNENKDTIISVKIMRTNDMDSALERGEIDFSICDTDLVKNKYLNQPLFHLTDQLVSGPTFTELMGTQPVGFLSLLEYPLIMYSSISYRRRYLNTFFAERGIRITPAIEIDDARIAIELVKQNQGIACLSSLYLREAVLNKDISIIPTIEPLPERTIGICYSQGKMSCGCEAFAHYLLSTSTLM